MLDGRTAGSSHPRTIYLWMFIDAVMRIGAARLGRADLTPPDRPAGVADIPRAAAEAMLVAGLRTDRRTPRLLADLWASDADARTSRRGMDRATRRVAQLIARRPAWVSADVLPGDALFIYDAVRLLRPRRVIEIGTGSGFSGLFLLAALSDAGRPRIDSEGRSAVESFDVCVRCSWDERYLTGAAIGQVAPGLRRAIRFHRGKGAADARAILAGHCFEMAFIDAMHRHPWPLADAISIAPLLAPGAWICLHDIALVEVALHRAAARRRDTTSWQYRGPQLLFDYWPWPKVRGVGLGANVGAVQVPDPAALTRASFADLLRYPWEVKPTPALTAIVGEPVRLRRAFTPPMPEIEQTRQP